MAGDSHEHRHRHRHRHNSTGIDEEETGGKLKWYERKTRDAIGEDEEMIAKREIEAQLDTTEAGDENALPIRLPNGKIVFPKKDVDRAHYTGFVNGKFTTDEAALSKELPKGPTREERVRTEKERKAFLKKLQKLGITEEEYNAKLEEKKLLADATEKLKIEKGGEETEVNSDDNKDDNVFKYGFSDDNNEDESEKEDNQEEDIKIPRKRAKKITIGEQEEDIKKKTFLTSHTFHYLKEAFESPDTIRAALATCCTKMLSDISSRLYAKDLLNFIRDAEAYCEYYRYSSDTQLQKEVEILSKEIDVSIGLVLKDVGSEGPLANLANARKERERRERIKLLNEVVLGNGSAYDKLQKAVVQGDSAEGYEIMRLVKNTHMILKKRKFIASPLILKLFENIPLTDGISDINPVQTGSTNVQAQLRLIKKRMGIAEKDNKAGVVVQKGASKKFEKRKIAERREQIALEKLMAENTAEGSRMEKIAVSSVTISELFLIYIKIVRTFPSSPLMETAVQGIRKYMRLISVIFLQDLANTFKQCIVFHAWDIASAVRVKAVSDFIVSTQDKGAASIQSGINFGALSCDNHGSDSDEDSKDENEAASINGFLTRSKKGQKAQRKLKKQKNEAKGGNKIIARSEFEILGDKSLPAQTILQPLCLAYNPELQLVTPVETNKFNIAVDGEKILKVQHGMTIQVGLEMCEFCIKVAHSFSNEYIKQSLKNASKEAGSSIEAQELAVDYSIPLAYCLLVAPDCVSSLPDRLNCSSRYDNGYGLTTQYSHGHTNQNRSFEARAKTLYKMREDSVVAPEQTLAASLATSLSECFKNFKGVVKSDSDRAASAVGVLVALSWLAKTDADRAVLLKSASEILRRLPASRLSLQTVPTEKYYVPESPKGCFQICALIEDDITKDEKLNSSKNSKNNGHTISNDQLNWQKERDSIYALILGEDRIF